MPVDHTKIDSTKKTTPDEASQPYNYASFPKSGSDEVKQAYQAQKDYLDSLKSKK